MTYDMTTLAGSEAAEGLHVGETGAAIDIGALNCQGQAHICAPIDSGDRNAEISEREAWSRDFTNIAGSVHVGVGLIRICDGRAVVTQISNFIEVGVGLV